MAYEIFSRKQRPYISIALVINLIVAPEAQNLREPHFPPYVHAKTVL